MMAPAVVAVVAALQKAGTRVRFVGGSVRDAILARPVKDVDIATPDRPETVIELLRRAGIKVIPTGIKHGTVTAIVGKATFEITTLRRDVENFGRHARVEFTDDWQADAARRDFTMNAMSCDPKGLVHDYFGGLADLARGQVRFVGSAAARIEEDVLRLLRFYRFHAHYGRAAPDAAGRAACRKLAAKLPSLSGERVRDETLKLLTAAKPAVTLRIMQEDRVLRHYLPEAQDFARVARLARIETPARVDALRRLAALLDADADSARDVGIRLRLSNAQKDRLVALRFLLPVFAAPADAPARRRFLYQHGAERLRDLILLAAAGPKPPRGATVAVCLDEAERWVRPEFPLGGQDMMRAGIAKGPAVGEAMRASEAAWVESDFTLTREQLIARIGQTAN